jgi:ketopantoate reductase
MKDQIIVIIGLGQLGRIFAGAFLRNGAVAVPVNRGDDLHLAAARWPAPGLVLVAVAEGDLHPVLAAMPENWKTRLGLIQNELLPRDWLRHGIESPTVASVWFEKKKGMDAKPLIATPIHGPAAHFMADSLAGIDIPARVIESEEALLHELVRKNVYILTTNIAGIKTGGNAGELWTNHRDFALTVANEVMDIQDWLTGRKNGREKLIQGMVEAIDADPGHQCMGRSAPARLARNLTFADEAGLAVPALRSIAQSLNGN